MGTRNKSKLVISVTSGQSLALLRGQLRFAVQGGFDVYLMTSPGHGSSAFARREGATLIPIRMEREISPIADGLAAFRVFLALRKLRPDIVNASTPKAGFLVTVAARAAGVPSRVFTLRGFRSSTIRGVRGRIVRWTEKASCGLATRVFCISKALRDEAIVDGLVSDSKAIVLGFGSSNGVDTSRFFASPDVHLQADLLRSRLRIPEKVPVVGFVGRLTRDKGVVELIAAWHLLRSKYPDLHLIVVGAQESGDPLPDETRLELAGYDHVHLLGHVADPSSAYLAMDVLALPTYREGFGTVLLEAAAMGRPVVASRVGGCVEAVVDGETGTLVPPRDVEALSSALGAYLQDRSLAERHGKAGRRRVVAEFSSERIWRAQIVEYERMLAR